MLQETTVNTGTSLSSQQFLNNRMAATWILILVNVLLSDACIPQQTSQTSSFNPRILSALYGYDNCIGAVNNFDTEEEYMEDLKRRNCTVVMGPDGKEIANVGPALNI